MANADRQKAVENAMNKPANHVTGGGGGKGNYAYVNTQLLERLGIQQYKPVIGDNFIRIINPKNLNLFWHQRIYVHRNIGANNLSFLCLKYMFNKPCPICEEAKQIKDANPKGYDKDEVKALYPKQRDLIFVVDLSDDDTIAKGIQWWDAPLFKYQTKEKPENSVASNFRALSKDPRTGVTLDISDPESGFDLYFKREGEGTDTTYSAYRLMDQVAIQHPEWLEMVPETYEEVLAIPTYEQVKAEFEGGIEEAPATEEGSETETAPATTTETTAANTTQQAATTPPATTKGGGYKNRGATQQAVPTTTNATPATNTAQGQSVQNKIDEIRRKQEAARAAQQNK